MQCVLKKVQCVSCLLSKLYAEQSQCVHCYWSTDMHRCCKCGSIPAVASAQMKKSLTLVYQWWQLRCCISDGKDTWKKKNGVGLLTPHRTSLADRWKSGILLSGFVIPLLSWDIFWRGTGTWAWASHTDCIWFPFEGCCQPAMGNVPTVPRGCLCSPRRARWSTSTCWAAVVGEPESITHSLFLWLVGIHLPSRVLRLPAAASWPLPPREGVISPRRSGLAGIWGSSHWFEEADLS